VRCVHRSSSACGLSSGGFTLLECVIAVAIVGFAILVAATALSAQARSADRLKARQQLLRSAEATLERVRAGALPLASASCDTAAELESEADPIRSTLQVRQLETPGLYEVTAHAARTVRGHSIEVTLQTMVWRAQ